MYIKNGEEFMKKTGQLSKLALAGILSGGMLISSSYLMADEGEKAGTEEAKKEETKYKEVHGCKGQNVCKGLGGCAITDAKLKTLAEKAGVPVEKAGKAHGCHGKNECKGLGGCKVTEADYKRLKDAKDKAAKKTEEKTEETAE